MRRFIFLLAAVSCLTVTACALDAFGDKDLEAGFGDNLHSISVSTNLGAGSGDDFTVPGLDVKLYDVGHYDDESGDYILDSEFEKYRLSQDMKTLAGNLYAYFRRDGMAARCIMPTDDTGRVVFDNLVSGMYLIAGDIFESANMKYRPVPALVCLDGQDAGLAMAFDSLETGRGRISSMTVHGRFESDVEKPGEVQAELLRDGRSYDVKSLNNKNGWSHVWKKLSGDYYWSVVEKDVPDDLCLRISGGSNSCTLAHAKFLGDYANDRAIVSDVTIPDTEISGGPGVDGDSRAGHAIGRFELAWLFAILIAGIVCFVVYFRMNRRK